jgi:hypothetical protein
MMPVCSNSSLMHVQKWFKHLNAWKTYSSFVSVKSRITFAHWHVFSLTMSVDIEMVAWASNFQQSFSQHPQTPRTVNSVNKRKKANENLDPHGTVASQAAQAPTSHRRLESDKKVNREQTPCCCYWPTRSSITYWRLTSDELAVA